MAVTRLEPSYTMLWVLWIIGFVVIEGQALINRKEGATLSCHVWEWFSVRRKGKWWLLRRMFLVVFMAALTAHFINPRWVW